MAFLPAKLENFSHNLRWIFFRFLFVIREESPKILRYSRTMKMGAISRGEAFTSLLQYHLWRVTTISLARHSSKKNVTRYSLVMLFILRLTQKKFAEKSYSTFHFDLKIWLKFVCFDSLVVVASSSAPEAEFVNKMSTKKTSKLKVK